MKDIIPFTGIFVFFTIKSTAIRRIVFDKFFASSADSLNQYITLSFCAINNTLSTKISKSCMSRISYHKKKYRLRNRNWKPIFFNTYRLTFYTGSEIAGASVIAQIKKQLTVLLIFCNADSHRLLRNHEAAEQRKQHTSNHDLRTGHEYTSIMWLSSVQTVLSQYSKKTCHCVRFSAHGVALQRQTKRSISAIDAAGASRTRLIAIALFSADPCSGAAPLAGCAA